jgi:septum formation protein
MVKRAPLVLASKSMARQAMLAAAGVEFVAAPTDFDEAPLKRRYLAAGKPPSALAAGLAEAKARAVIPQTADAIMIGADQVLICDGQLFHKAPDRAGARSVLRRLSGCCHELHVAVCVLGPGAVVWCHESLARLWMRPLSDDFIDRYLDQMGGEVLWSVGCYQIEGLGVQLFERIEGDHFTIQGLPLLPLLGYLRRAGLMPA